MIQKLVFILTLSFNASNSFADEDEQAAVELAMGALDKFMLAFNKWDLEAVGRTFSW